MGGWVTCLSVLSPFGLSIIFGRKSCMLIPVRSVQVKLSILLPNPQVVPMFIVRRESYLLLAGEAFGRLRLMGFVCLRT